MCESLIAFVLCVEPRFPTDYPTGCLLGCVNVTDCLSQEQFRQQVSETLIFTFKKHKRHKKSTTANDKTIQAKPPTTVFYFSVLRGERWEDRLELKCAMKPYKNPSKLALRFSSSCAR